MLRSMILAVVRSRRVERLVETMPVSRTVVDRFVAGDEISDALRVSGDLIADGLGVIVNHLSEDATTPQQALANGGEYVALLDALSGAELTPAAEISVELSALGQRFDEAVAEDRVRAICAKASEAGTMVTLDMRGHATIDSTLEILGRLRVDFPTVGVAIQANLRRAEADCRELAVDGSRVRLCKGAYREPESIAYPSRLEVDKSFVRCLNILMSGPGYPMIATHDPRLVAIAEDRAKWFARSCDEFEFQMLYGVRPDEHRRLLGAGYAARVYLPYGTYWYPYLMRRLYERPRDLALFARALRSRA